MLEFARVARGIDADRSQRSLQRVGHAVGALCMQDLVRWQLGLHVLLEKYVQAKLPSHEILHAQRADSVADPLQASLAAIGVDTARDTGEFKHSEDAQNFETWGGGQDMKEAQL